MKIIRKLEKIILALIIGLVVPILGLLAFWWGALSFLSEKLWLLAVLTGLVPGILVDIIFLKRVVRIAYKLDIKIWMAIHLFYSVGIFGFFMGVPVVNALLAIPAGFVVGGKLVAENADMLRIRKGARRTAWFTTGVLFLVCTTSASLALRDPYTAGNLQGMFGLKFSVTENMVFALILVGGLLLLAFNLVLTVATVRFAQTFLQQR